MAPMQALASGWQEFGRVSVKKGKDLGILFQKYLILLDKSLLMTVFVLDLNTLQLQHCRVCDMQG